MKGAMEERLWDAEGEEASGLAAGPMIVTREGSGSAATGKRVATSVVALALALVLGWPTVVRADEPGESGSLWVGPRAGVGVGISGPRFGWMAGLEVSYRSPYYFYYTVELGFTHLLPQSVSVPESEQVPAHDVDVTGLYIVPLTLDIGFRYAVGRARLRVGVGFGAFFSTETVEAMGEEERELIASFGFRPGVGVDIVSRRGNGMFMIDAYYLWQDADFEVTGGDRDVDSFFLTFGYSWQVLGEEGHR